MFGLRSTRLFWKSTTVALLVSTGEVAALIANCQQGCYIDSDCATGLCVSPYQLLIDDGVFDRFTNECIGKAVIFVDTCVSCSVFPTVICPTGSGVGDPHFRTFDGTKYSFHGQCDLVMARTPSMGSFDLPLTLHVRTTIQSRYSYISEAALQIGSDVLEVSVNGKYYVNGQVNVKLPYLMAGHYPVSKNEKSRMEPTSRKNPSLVNRTRTVYQIELDDGVNIEINTFKQMLHVSVKGRLPNTVGMLGVTGTVGLIGRDGVTVMKDADAMGMEWQVRDDEPHLFQDMNRAPQYPEQCILPSVTGRGRRMLRSNEDYERAKIACDNIKDRELQEFCIEDILITGDFDLVNAYSY